MKCPKCKKKIENGQKFCSYCGTAIPEKSKKKIDKRILIPACVAGVCGVAVLGTVLLTNPQQTSAGKLEKKIEAGNRYLESADYEKAEVAFNEALSIDAKSSEAALGLAKVCNEKKDPEGALSYLKLANENLGSMSKKQVEDQNIDWEKKTEDYQKTFDTTSQLFLASGNEKQAEYVNEEKEKAQQTLVVIVNVVKENDGSQKKDDKEDDKPIADISNGNGDDTSSIGSSGTDKTGADPTEIPKTQVIDPDAPETPSVTPGGTDGEPETPSVTPGGTDGEPETPSVTPGGTDGEPETPSVTPGGTDGEPETPSVTPGGTDGEPETPSVTPGGIDGEPETPSVTPGGTDGEPETPSVTPGESDEEPGTPNDTPDEDPGTSGETPVEPVVSDSDILYDFVTQNILSVEPLLTSQSASYDFGSGNIPSLNGTISYQVEDLDGDGSSELLVVNTYNGQIGFDIYRVEEASVVSVGHVNSHYNCMGNISQERNYGMTQLCFLKDAGEYYEIGLAGNSNGSLSDGNQGTVQTSVELYVLSGNEIVMKDAVSIRNGLYVLSNSNGDAGNEGGKAEFTTRLNEMGLDGNWIAESADMLTSMDLAGNPAQSVAGVTDPLRNGMAAIESGVQNVTYINGLMLANTGTISLNILDHPETQTCTENYQQIPADEAADEPVPAEEDVVVEEPLVEESADGTETETDETETDGTADTEGDGQANEPDEEIDIETLEQEENGTGLEETNEVSETVPDENVPEEPEMEYGIPVATEDGTYTQEDSYPTEEVYTPDEDQTVSENIYTPEQEIIYDDIEAEDQTDVEADNSGSYESDPYTENEDLSEDYGEGEAAAASPDEILENYVNENIWPVSTQLVSQTMSYDYGTNTIPGSDGILGIHKGDLDGDTFPELLVIRFQSGQIVWDIYRINGSEVEFVSTTVPSCNGLAQAMGDMDYEMSQTCFLKDNSGSFFIGIASNYRNVEEGEGTPCVRTSLEVYSITFGACARLDSATILNGTYVYTNNDRSTSVEGGSEAFMSHAATAGLSGSWITENTDVLASMDVLNNPGQDLSMVPDPLENGIASKELYVQDLIILSGKMSAGSGTIDISVQDNTNLY